MPLDDSDPVANFQLIERELAAYSPTLAAKPRWVVLSKCDLLPLEQRESLFQRLNLAIFPTEQPLRGISAVSGEGIRPWILQLAEQVHLLRERHVPVTALQDAPTRAGKSLLAVESTEDDDKTDGGTDGDGDGEDGVQCIWVG